MAGNKNSGRKRISIAEKKLSGDFKKHIKRNQSQEQSELIAQENAPTRLDDNTKIDLPKEITNKEVIYWFNSYSENAKHNGYLLPQDLATLHLAAWNLQRLLDTMSEIDKLEADDPLNDHIETLYRRVTRLQNLFDKNCIKLSVSQPDRLKLVMDAIELNRKQKEAEQQQSAIMRVISKNDS